MMIPNIVTKFQNFDIFKHFLTFFICRLLTPACKVLIPLRWAVIVSVTDVELYYSAATLVSMVRFPSVKQWRNCSGSYAHMR